MPGPMNHLLFGIHELLSHLQRIAFGQEKLKSIWSERKWLSLENVITVNPRNQDRAIGSVNQESGNPAGGFLPTHCSPYKQGLQKTGLKAL